MLLDGVAGGPARRWFRGVGRATGAASPGSAAVVLALAWPCSQQRGALPRTLCSVDAPVGVVSRRRRARDGCGRPWLLKNPSISTSSAIISHSHDFAALTDGTSHPPPRQRSRRVQDSIELFSDPQLRRNRLVRHSSTVCGGEPQNSPQSDRRYARPRKVTHTRDAIDAALRPTPPFRPAQTQRRRDHVRLRHE